MKKIISVIFALAAVVAAWAQGGSGVGYDPANPPDPQTGYRLSVKAVPETGGVTTPSHHAYFPEGETVWCEANAKIGYEFRAWMEGDRVVSTDRSFNYVMPGNDVELTAWFDKVDFDPENPGDPFLDGYTHKVSVFVTPSTGGNVNNRTFLLREGQEEWIYAYPNTGYKFSCWKVDGEIVSVDRELLVKMGENNLEYTAQFVYDPENPGDPLPNSWNPATGELVIDHFSKGNLWDAVNNIVGYDNLGKVTSITVIGAMDNYDFGVVGNLPQLVTADFSRTSGCEYVPSWIFQNRESLTKVLLPASVTSIQYAAFSGCQNLSELVVYASMPPAIDSDNVFEGVPANMVVKVYSNSLDLYMTAPVWQNYKIMTIDEDSTALTVSLPDDAADGRYRNASLQLTNISTGHVQRLVITGTRTKYVFGNLIPDLKYSLRVVSSNGITIGSYEDFEMPKEGLDYKFASLLPLQEVTLSVKTPDGADVTGQVNVSWFDSAHVFLGNGQSLAGMPAGAEVGYEISIPRELGVTYAAPANGTWTVKENGNTVAVVLEKLPTFEIAGKLTDASTGEPVAGGYVTVSQTVNGLYDVAFTAVADANGDYKLTVFDAPGKLTAGSPDHIESTSAFSGKEEGMAVKGVAVKPLHGTAITLSLVCRENVAKGSAEGEFAAFDDYANVDFRVRNLTKGSDVDFRMKYPRMLLLDEVAEGDKIEITATPKNGAYNSAAATAAISGGKGEARLAFTQNGDIRMSYKATDAEEVVALLYDKDGKLQKKTTYSEKEAAFNGVADGEYSVVTMAASKLFSGAGSLAELSSSVLAAGKDYLLSSVTAESGYITKVELEAVPAFDETLFYYTGAETSVSVNKTSVTVGATVTVRSKVDFLPEYEGRIGNVKIIFTIPDGCEYVDNSLLVAGAGASFTVIDDGRLSVEVPAKDASPRFCIIPRKGGEYRPSAMVEFELDGTTVSQPIGSALVSAGDFSLSVPEKTSVAAITARGVATPLSDVKLYDNDVLVGTTRTLTNGEWRMKFDLYNPDANPEHSIYAEITTAEGVKYRTTTGKTVYDKEWAELTDINMIYGGTTVDFNHIDATTVPASYSYVPGNDMFTFRTVFRDGHAEKVKSLDFVILLSDGSRRRIEGKYLPSSGAWVCALSFPDVNRLPVNVKVIYVETRDEKESASQIADNPGEPFRCPDVIPVIDPSGYVYEAVPSNRLEGVEATIFYKEWVEDMYGDVSENVVKWDAEAYAQKNPLFTDADGMYQWDVPQGEWQVRFEKEGYETVSTGWLPVPPPQLDVNMGMVQTVRPQVKEAHAYDNAVEIEFDKYMEPAHLNTATIAVTVNGTKVDGTVSMVNAEETEDGKQFASIVRFNAAQPFAASTVKLMVSNRVTSYAGIRMEEAFEQEFTVEPEITAIVAPERMEAYVGVDSELVVKVEPAKAAAGRTLLVKAGSEFVNVAESFKIGEDGNAVVKFNGELPGDADLMLSVEGSKLPAVATRVMFSIMPPPAEAPVASVKSGSVVAKGSVVELSSVTPDVAVYYTVDGMSPVDSQTRKLYSAPIVITNDVTIKAVAQGEAWLDSPVSEFSYTVQVAEAPVASVANSSVVAKGSTVALSTESAGVAIYYTVDGTSPVDSRTRKLYSAPIVITNDVTIKAIAEDAAWISSGVAEFSYSVQVAEAPVASILTESMVDEGTEVELSTSTENVSIYYTLDGTSPLDSPTRILYTTPIVIKEETRILAVAMGDEWLDSDVAEFHYTVNPDSGVEWIETDGLKVVPAYNGDGFTVKGVAGRMCKVVVFDEGGNAAMAGMTLTEDTTVSMSELAPGVYIVVAECDAHRAVLKIMKR